MHTSGKDMVMFMMVIVFVLLAITMKSYADNCASFTEACTPDDVINLKKSETAFYSLACVLAVLTFMVPLMPLPKSVKKMLAV